MHLHIHSLYSCIACMHQASRTPTVQLRIHRLYSMLWGLERSWAFSLLWFTIFRNIQLILLITHIAACLFFFLTNHAHYVKFDGLSDNQIEALGITPADAEASSWLGLTPQEVNEWPIAHLYIRSLYWSMVTFTTVGYGDFTPVTVTEQVFVTVRSVSLRWLLSRCCVTARRLSAGRLHAPSACALCCGALRPDHCMCA
jgi:Ion channel